MATSSTPRFEQDAQRVKDSNFVSYLVSLRGLYKDKPKQEAQAAPQQAPTADDTQKKKKKPAILGGSNDNLDPDVQDNL